ncbi:PDR/VanB family oxidoreductase [Neobacillus sp. D3-1R]|uniref:PDR/VanB family oxidoreductase n=1 Tax=Neobacillus sp. D3-1R TaxID=3445778 RepID=UPI003FA03061
MYKEKTIPVYVDSIHEETKQIKSFTLRAMNGKPLPPFSGGSHIITYLDGPNGLISRPYSLTNYQEQPDCYQIAIRLSDHSKGGSIFWHHHVNVGDRLHISFPKNHFPLSDKAKHHVFYAAGIGITPFLSMMSVLKEDGASFELHYTTKSHQSCAFYSYLKENYDEQISFYFSNVKRLTTDSLFNHTIGTRVYICGPEHFMKNFVEVAKKIGYPTSSIHVEHFTAPHVMNPSPFQVTLPDGESIKVEKDQSLLEALLAAGKRVPFSCRIGRCGTCELKVLEGEIEHYDTFLSEEQKKSQQRILSCVSRAKSDKLIIRYP